MPVLTAADLPKPVTVFDPKLDGYKSIRIPSIVGTRSGTLLAFAEGRATATDQAQNKLLLKRSQDLGQTWSPVITIADAGSKSLNNPCAVVEAETQTVFLFYQQYPAGIAERSAKLLPGLTGDSIVRNFVIHSRDEGKTWSQPRDITATTKRPTGVTTLASGPGVGIQLRHGPHRGRLIIPFNEGPYEAWRVYSVISDDRGETWRMGDVVPDAFQKRADGRLISTVNEVQMVELAGANAGAVRMNARRWAGAPVRKTSLSLDGGQSWGPVRDVPELKDPSCMSSILRWSDPADGRKNRVAFTGPQSTRRERGTLFLSYDDGETWPIQKLIVPLSFAYSCLVALPHGDIGCLYEADGMMTIAFVTVKLDWLSDGKDRWEVKP